MPIYPYSFTMPPVNKQDIPSNGVPGEFLGISAGGVLDWLPVSGGSGTGDLLAANNLSELTPTAGTARTNLGLGTGDSPTFANLTLTSPSLASSAPVTISQTWDAVGQTFTALKVNAAGTSGTNSAAGSLLLDLQVGGVSTVSVKKDGFLLLPSVGLVGIATLNQSIGSTSTRLGFGTDYIYVQIGNGSMSAFHNSGYHSGRDQFIGWSSNIYPGYSALAPDVTLYRDGAANTLALRNGAAAQTFNVYGTYSSITDYKRLSLSCSASTGNATIGVPFNSVLAVTGGSATATVATVTFAAQAAAFPVGSSVTVTGVTPAGYNATAVVTASTTTSVSYASTVNAAYVSGGTATISGSAALTLTAAGNVGIGTTAPGAKLQVSYANQVLTGNVTDLDVSAKHHIAAYTPDTAGINVGASLGLGGCYLNNTNYITFGAIAGRKELATNNNAQGYLSFLTASNGGGLIERMRIDSVGNLGIGTTSPTSKLHVVGDFTLTGYIVAGNFGTIASEHSFSPRVNGIGAGPVLAVETSSLWTAGVARFRNTKNNWSILFPSTSTATIQLGGTDLNFPALKQTGASIDVRLADDNGFASIQDLYRRFGTGTPEGVVTAPTGAVYHNTSGGSITTFYVKESSPTPNTGWVGK